ncbi:winged helix-turn-helix domain-containing protein [Streptomyces sp. NPDC013178]|uniref:helix-turn-helix domain-containing protein n=1 Tax=Streptomyces sp. NPDC013178 TaxID=3155118 RepID=UPI0033F52DB1
MNALASTGQPKPPKLSDGRFAELEMELALEPAVHWLGGPALDLARIRELIARTFRLDGSSAAVWRLIHRHGWSWRCAARQALEHDEGAVGL